MNELTTDQPALRSFSEEGFFESAKLEHLSSAALAKDEAINLSTVALAKVEANLRGLGYGL